ncbi:hypothetical protein ACGFZL_16715 [Streptomyces sp. NPDC048182]|uniref:hypothetical protein n=1 Tax=Streptomyces sp. NPDC048182 TaxID=3365507 RepID=UPI00371CB7DA
MTSERWRLPENVTVSFSGASCRVPTVNPWFGTAEIRHTPLAPNRTVTFPPSDGTVYTPAPPSQPWAPPPAGDGAGADGAVRVGVGLGVRGARAVGEGGGVLGRALLGEGLGAGGVLAAGVGRGEGVSSSGADRATGAVGRVEPTTKWMVMITAVTLAAVQHSQMTR